MTVISRWCTEPEQPSSPFIRHTHPLPAELSANIAALADRMRVPLESVLLAAHAKVLALLTGERYVVTAYVPSVCENSDHMPLLYGVSVEDGDWRSLVEAADRADRQALALTPARLCEVLLDLSGEPDSTARPAAILSVAFNRSVEGLQLWLTARSDVVDAPYAARIAGYYAAALDRMAAGSGEEHHRQCLLADDELAFQLDGLAGTPRALPDRRVHELFEERVRRTPDRVAAVCGAETWTYDKLNRRANQIAHALLARGLGRESVVAVITERNLDWMAAVLGVFKAGGAYLPVERHFPAERVAAMLSRSGCRIALVEDAATEIITAMTAQTRSELETIRLSDTYTQRSAEEDPGIAVEGGQLAYIYFTSGSTGEPKGAMCEHKGLLNHLFAKIDDLDIGPEQVVAQTAPQCFDISLWQLVSSLVAGGSTLIVGQKAILDIERYLDTLVEGGVEVLQVVPSYLEMMLSHLEERPRELGRLRCVSATGEALKKELVERWFAAYPGIKLINAYGLTETSDDTNHEVMDRAPREDRVPLGPAVNNVRVYVVDEQLNPVPLGAPGEIVFSGVCVGRGYINDPERTAAAFGHDPHRPGERLYRSGDIGRWLPQGKLEFLGRRDTQVKIRGFRIEVGEIENTLLKAPAVRDAAVVPVDSSSGARHLVAFYSADAEVPVSELEKTLAAELPDYMLPQRYLWCETLPLTGNGKVDKKNLARQAAEAAQTEGELGAADAPRTHSERRLAAAWADVLKVPVERIARHHHFFESGGTSLSAVRLGVALGRAVSLEELVSHPVLADLAQLIDDHERHRKEQQA
ncbi:amino acid adenylation domain-containing protein [Streptomyces sp. NPDC048611]|uniref:non-ribosomal peptide synthetase n=1 Tax=Streptomyces sp. NPDC048611 TaxID=3155635 RepID=UPI0034190559